MGSLPTSPSEVGGGAHEFQVDGDTSRGWPGQTTPPRLTADISGEITASIARRCPDRNRLSPTTSAVLGTVAVGIEGRHALDGDRVLGIANPGSRVVSTTRHRSSPTSGWRGCAPGRSPG